MNTSRSPRRLPPPRQIIRAEVHFMSSRPPKKLSRFSLFSKQNLIATVVAMLLTPLVLSGCSPSSRGLTDNVLVGVWSSVNTDRMNVTFTGSHHYRAVVPSNFFSIEMFVRGTPKWSTPKTVKGYWKISHAGGDHVDLFEGSKPDGSFMIIFWDSTNSKLRFEWSTQSRPSSIWLSRRESR